MAMVTREGVKDRAKGAHTRQAILAAAIARFGREGYRATSVADIARDAKVGGTVAYAYFPGKEALFLAALDEDAAGIIDDALKTLLKGPLAPDWRRTLIFTLLEAVDHHPLARRILAGLEPGVTDRVLQLPALEELRKVCGDLLEAEQRAGAIRADVDPHQMANGIVTIFISLLVTAVQLGGTQGAAMYGADVAAVMEAALDRTPPPRSA